MTDNSQLRSEIPANRSRGCRLWLVLAAGFVLCVLLACSGATYVVYRGLNVIVETYQLAAQPSLDGVPVDLEVRPQTRIEDGLGDQLIGPPYGFMFNLRDPGGRMKRARLHQVRVVPHGGGEFIAPVTNGDNLAQQGFVLLYADNQQQPLGRSVRIYADIEVFRDDGSSVRKELEFSLTRGSRASLNIP